MKLWNEKIEIIFHNFIHIMAFLNIILFTIMFLIIIKEEDMVKYTGGIKYYGNDGFTAIDYFGLTFFVLLSLYAYRQKAFEDMFFSNQTFGQGIDRKMGQITDRTLAFLFQVSMSLTTIRGWPSLQ